MRAALILIALAATASASPGQDLQKARDYFRLKDCGSAMPVLNFLLYPNEQLAQRGDLVEAHSMLGACYCDVDKRAEARIEFVKVLQLQPEKNLNDLTFSSCAIGLFDQTKADLAAQVKRDEELKKLAEDRERLRKYRESLVVYETRPYGVNFVPFGAGQYQEHRNGRGLFFTISEGVTFGTSMGIFLYLAGTYGLVAKVPLTEGPRVRTLQQVEVASGIAFIGFYAIGVYDSLRHHKPRAQIQGDDSLLPPELRDLEKKPTTPKKTSLLERIQVAPMLTPSGVGIGIGWEN